MTGWGAAVFPEKGKGKVQEAAVLFTETGSAFLPVALRRGGGGGQGRERS